MYLNPDTISSNPYWNVVQVAMRVFGVLLFSRAALLKFRSLVMFRGVLEDYRILPKILVAPATVAVPFAEGAVAAMLLIGRLQTLGEFSAAMLLVVFSGAIAVNVQRGRTYIDCGCGDVRTRQPLRWAMVVRNLTIAAILVLCAIKSATAPELPGVLVAGAAGISMFILYASHEVLVAMSLLPRQALTPAMRRLGWPPHVGEER